LDPATSDGGRSDESTSHSVIPHRNNFANGGRHLDAQSSHAHHRGRRLHARCPALDTVRSFINRMPGIAPGAAAVTVVSTSAANPEPQRNQSAISTGDPASVGCSSAADPGCTASFWEARSPGVFVLSRPVVSSRAEAPVYAHELAHGLLGMCHVDGQRIGGSALSLMSAGPETLTRPTDAFSSYDLAAMSAVFGSGIGPGGTRNDLERVGLLSTTGDQLYR